MLLWVNGLVFLTKRASPDLRFWFLSALTYVKLWKSSCVLSKDFINQVSVMAVTIFRLESNCALSLDSLLSNFLAFVWQIRWMDQCCTQKGFCTILFWSCTALKFKILISFSSIFNLNFSSSASLPSLQFASGKSLRTKSLDLLYIHSAVWSPFHWEI